VPSLADWLHTIFVVESADQWDLLVFSVVHGVYFSCPLSLAPLSLWLTGSTLSLLLRVPTVFFVVHVVYFLDPLSLVPSLADWLHAIFVVESADCVFCLLRCLFLVPSLAPCYLAAGRRDCRLV
jgi:hypothetical protein